MKVAITNIEQTTDELHGFGLLDYNINIVVDPVWSMRVSPFSFAGPKRHNDPGIAFEKLPKIGKLAPKLRAQGYRGKLLTPLPVPREL